MLKDKISKISGSGMKLLKRFREDRAGAAAVEFVFIAPLLITLYLGTMEISQGLEINKKVARASGVIGDLVGQEETVTKQKLQDVMAIGQAMLLPYRRTTPTLTVSLVSIDASLNPKVVWSRRGKGTAYSVPYAANSATTVPPNLAIADTFLIRVETKLEYIPITSWTLKKDQAGAEGAYAIDMNERYYLRPRMTDSVTCTDC
jgi:Flp pilus assembly protein TadG